MLKSGKILFTLLGISALVLVSGVVAYQVIRAGGEQADVNVENVENFNYTNEADTLHTKVNESLGATYDEFDVQGGEQCPDDRPVANMCNLNANQLNTVVVDITTSTSTACAIKNTWGTSTIDVGRDIYAIIEDQIPTSTTWRVATSTRIMSYEGLTAQTGMDLVDGLLVASSTHLTIQPTSTIRILWKLNEYIIFAASGTPFAGHSGTSDKAFRSDSVLPSGRCYVEYRHD